MPTTSAYVEIREDQMKVIATQIQRWLEKKHITHERFVELYNTMKNRKYPDGTVAPMNRFRILSYLNLARCRSSTHVAKVPRCGEIEVISLVIHQPVEVLLGLEKESTSELLDVTSTSDDAASLLELMRSCQSETEELIGWAEWLPCSLETPEFMHAHHEALFPNPGDVVTWDGIGHTRRLELLSNGSKRKWRLTYLMFLSDFKRVVYGQREYAAIPNKIRKECLDNLIRLLSTPELGIRMIMADDEHDRDAQALRFDLRNYDSVITWDEKLMILRDHLGISFYSRKPRNTKYWRGMQEEFIAAARFSKKEEVVEFARSLSKEIRSDKDKQIGHRLKRK